MDRRHFIYSATALIMTPELVLADEGSLAYKKGLVRRRLRRGETVFIDFYTTWCTTCASQRRTINALRSGNPAYNDAITFVNVDWDIHRRSKLSKDLRVPRRSTLVVLKGDDEIGRIVAGTGQGQIKALLDAALGAATA